MKPEFSIRSLSVKRKIWIAISLVTCIPIILLFQYLSGYQISFWAGIAAFVLVLLGWWIVFEVFSSIVKLYSQSRKTLEKIGEYPPPVPNEVESLDSVINILSSKVKSSFEQLKEFSQKTDELSKEVSKKVFVLSTILQANDLFSKEVPCEEILQFFIQRLSEILRMKMAFCACRSNEADQLTVVAYTGVDVSKVEHIFEKDQIQLSKIRRPVAVDAKNKPGSYAALPKEFGMDNIVFYPVASKGQIIGLICIGNNENGFIFSDDDLNTLNLFAQNVSLIWEHEKLSVKVDELEVFDYLTGLYNEKFLVKRLDEEIGRALIYQRPCGFLLLEILNYDDYQKNVGLLEAEKLVKKAGKIFRETLRPIDVPARLGPNRLGAILIEKNKRHSQTVAQSVKERLIYVFKEQIDLAFSVAENPIDGTTAQELIQFAKTHISPSGANEIPQKD